MPKKIKRSSMKNNTFAVKKDCKNSKDIANLATGLKIVDDCGDIE